MDILQMILNRLHTLLIAMILIASCQEKPKTCQDFHSGTFKIEEPEEGYSVRIERNDSTQIETNLNTGAITTAQIKWDNVCNYQLTYTESTSEQATNLIGKVLLVRITGVQGNSYTYEAVLRGTQTITPGQIELVEQ